MMIAKAIGPAAYLLVSIALLPAAFLARADEERDPLALWQDDQGSSVRAAFKAEFAWFDQTDSWFGDAEGNLGDSSTDWLEFALMPSLNGNYVLDNGSSFYGQLTLLAVGQEGIDAAGTNVGLGDTSDTAVERAYVGWRSGNLFPELGEDFLDISFGRQQYVAGTGFLFFSQANNGGDRSGFWLGDRKAADYAAIARVNYQGLKAELIYLKGNDNKAPDHPDHNTRASGVTLDYDLGELGSVGGGLYRLSANAKPRDGMDIYDGRFSLTPFKAWLPGTALDQLRLDGEYVVQDNGRAHDADGWYLSARYDFDRVKWSPALTYRYASFEGDGDPDDGSNRNFDPLFYGFYDWGYWYQGEILGEYVLINSNLNSHLLRLAVSPREDLAVSLSWYDFRLDKAAGMGVGSEAFAQEFNLILDWYPHNHLSFSLVGAYASPDRGARQFTGADDDWYYMMLYGKFSF
ncbi:alginate export family protein [Gallaecimonas sp. GXIMD4217]|uniref:alginate export family protein n=1 Tax=Gallaecimonas sp. GXIMD4217 TaxID=3131927 RepID=UPI00311B143C